MVQARRTTAEADLCITALCAVAAEQRLLESSIIRRTGADWDSLGEQSCS